MTKRLRFSSSEPNGRNLPAPTEPPNVAEATSAGFASYVELLICLEMARDISKQANPRPLEGQSTPPAQPEISVVDKHK
jgi:hypothetical protein